jgi:hypothetical protein
VIHESIVEQPVAATPEPSMLALLGFGLLALILFARGRCAGVVMAGIVAIAANAQANPVEQTTNFDEDIAIETDTFETPSGAVLFTTNGVGYTDWLAPNIAADLAGDSAIPAPIQSTASLVAFASEYQFLAEQGPQYVVLGGVGPAILDPHADYVTGFDVGIALAAATGPAYSILGSPIFTTVGERTYNDGVIEPDGSLLEGTVTFDIFDESIVEQPVSTPEPSMLALVGSGFIALLVLARRRAAGGTK